MKALNSPEDCQKCKQILFAQNHQVIIISNTGMHMQEWFFLLAELNVLELSFFHRYV